MNQEDLALWITRIFKTEENEINCEQLQALLPVYVDAEVASLAPGADVPAIKLHLAQCPDCTDLYQTLRRVAALTAANALPGAAELLAGLAPESEPAAAEGLAVVAS